MHYAFIFESIMLFCFGCAWPASIYKSYKSRTNKGKSVFFLYIILIGYINGIVFQYIIEKGVNYVFILFFINSLLVLTDIVLYYRNARIDKLQKQA